MERNGVLQEYIVSGTTKDELKRRLKAVLSPVPQSHPQQTPQTSDTPPTATYQTPIATSETLDSNISVPNPEPDEEAIATETVRRENIREGKKRAVTPEPAQTPKSVKDNQKVWRQQQLNRERKEREERERVLALIRQDREDRKARTERQKPSPILQGDSHNSEQPSQTPKSMFKVSEYRLQVRLFDGSSLRSNFAPTHTIRDDVRRWIDGQRSDGHTPYNLKQILTPLPNRTISISEENQPLGELGLGRTANLVMVPVQNYTEAYAASEASLPVRGLYAGYNLVAGAVGTVAGVLGSFLGIGPGQPTPQQSTSSDRSIPIPDSAPSSEGTGVGRRNIRTVRSNNIRTLHDQQPGQRDQQFYNGNQVCLKLMELGLRVAC